MEGDLKLGRCASILLALSMKNPPKMTSLLVRSRSSHDGAAVTEDVRKVFFSFITNTIGHKGQ